MKADEIREMVLLDMMIEHGVEVDDPNYAEIEVAVANTVAFQSRVFKATWAIFRTELIEGLRRRFDR